MERRTNRAGAGDNESEMRFGTLCAVTTYLKRRSLADWLASCKRHRLPDWTPSGGSADGAIERSASTALERSAAGKLQGGAGQAVTDRTMRW